MAHHGHLFTKKTFHKPTYCQVCTDMLWGLIQQGHICEVCNFVVHERCVRNVTTPCSTVALSHVQSPMVQHCWSEPGHFKRKFCQVCRKRLDETVGIRCEICEYFVHMDCMELSVPNCKECATYFPGRELSSVRHIHTWREGNLASNSKCVACKKTCWSSECLTGNRCEWCGFTAHGFCLKLVPAECGFGQFEPIYLPPHAVSIPRTEVPCSTIIGVASKTLTRAKDTMTRELSCPRSISEEFSSGDRDCRPVPSRGDSESDSMQPPAPPPSKHDKADKDEETLKVYDGNQGLRRRLFRPVSVQKSATVDQILSAGLRAFHITKPTENYYLTDAYDEVGSRVADPNPIASLKRREGKRPAIFLRFREEEKTTGEIQVYSGRLKTAQSIATIEVSDSSTVSDVVGAALDQFGLDPQTKLAYRMLKVVVEKGTVTERVLEADEKPWLLLKEHARDSLRQMEQIRFHMQSSEDPHGSTVALYVGNLTPNLNQRQYENVLLEYIGRDNKYSSIGPIYYEYGSLVITYEDSHKAVQAFYTLRESMHEEKNLLVMMLPALAPHMIPQGVTPLLVFVNVKSGGCQGQELIGSFRKLLNPYQVFDLDNGGPLPGLYVFRHIANYRILVCGGDGTIGWVLQCLDNVGQDSQCESPPCAIVPLGTGNDLARVLRWGPGYTGGETREDAQTLLKDVIDAEEIRLDRWTVVFHPDEKAEDKMPVNQAMQIGASAQSEDNTAIYVMNNYFGIGIDADLCLDFHNAREENPNKFNSRLHNKGVYVKMGLKKMVSRKMCKDLHREIRLEVDGKHIELPPVEGIIILNILSWGSGANPWGPEKEDQFSKPNHWDGMLEVVGVTGVVHLGQIQSGLRSAMRIAQGGHIKIRLNSDMPVQVDGEPWIQTPGDVVILKSALKATMLKKTKMKRRNTEAIMSPMTVTCPSPTPPSASSHHQLPIDD
ncbi:diacylglycerol kinase theta isoform X2 [Folsomia candida]|uniref:diacylglycerol kinase theta isoform X2 n=1 Tax=Folsomia candida TaxID=158441 RepID=UPI000B903C53|nr:diacylglycerol kinase theta isoform X2 [Folsomia candida]